MAVPVTPCGSDTVRLGSWPLRRCASRKRIQLNDHRTKKNAWALGPEKCVSYDIISLPKRFCDCEIVMKSPTTKRNVWNHHRKSLIAWEKSKELSQLSRNPKKESREKKKKKKILQTLPMETTPSQNLPCTSPCLKGGPVMGFFCRASSMVSTCGWISSYVTLTASRAP